MDNKNEILIYEDKDGKTKVCGYGRRKRYK